MKFKTGQIVIIYNTPACFGGGVGRITERDISEPTKPAYLVADLDDPEKDRWVAEEYLEMIYFTKPTFVEKLKRLFPTLVPKWFDAVVEKFQAIVKIIKG